MRLGISAIVMMSSLASSPFSTAGGWAEMTGPIGCPANDFTLTRSGDVLVATDEGVFRLDSSTSVWQPTGLANGGIHALLTASDGTVYAGGYGVWASADSGDSWQRSDEGMEGGGKTVHAFGELNGTILAATNRGLFSRLEGTDAWVYNEGGPAEAIRAIAISETGAVFIGLRQFVYRSTDGGESWSPQLWLSSVVTSIATAADGVVLVGAADDGFGPAIGYPGKLHLSLDGGETFSRLDVDADVEPGGSALKVQDLRSVAITEDGVLLVGGHRGSVPGGPGGGVWYSEDLGDTWNRTFFGDVDVLDIADLGADEVWIGSERGPMRPLTRADGIGVELVAAGLRSRAIEIFGLLATSEGLIVWGDGFRMQWWDKAGDAWYELQQQATTIRGVSVGLYSSVLVTAWGGMYLGNLVFPWGWGHWDETRDWEIDGFRPTMAAQDEEHGICAADARRIRCQDWLNWKEKRFEDESITGLASFRQRPVFAALKPFEPGAPARIVRSTSDLDSWKTVWSGSSAVRAGTLITAEDGRMYAFLDDGHLLVSDEHGENWDRRGGLPQPRDILVIDDKSTLYTVSSDRVMSSIDGGWSWTAFGEPLNGMAVTSIAVSDDDVFVGTSARGVLRHTSSRIRRPSSRRYLP